MGTPKGMITVQDAAQRLGRSLEQVRRYLREGKLDGERIGHQWFIREATVMYLVGEASQEGVMDNSLDTPRTLREVSPQERWGFFQRVNQQRGEIHQRWVSLGISVDVVEAIREEREAH